VFCCFNSEFTRKINKITNKTNKITKLFVFLSVLYVILLIFFVNSLLKQQSTQLPAMKAVISHENCVCPMKLAPGERDNSSCSAQINLDSALIEWLYKETTIFL
jgi:hypothetical protein